jgi:hypothetical protein
MSLILDGTNGENFPTWTTSTRPASPTTSQTGYNTTTGNIETYNGSSWIVGSIPAAGTNGNVLTDNGTTWVSQAPTLGAMTLLGTITPTASNSISLSGLTLTSYKQLQIIIKNIAGPVGSTSSIYLSSDNTNNAKIITTTSTGNYYSIFTVDLNSAMFNPIIFNSSGALLTTNIPTSHNITTSSTSIYFKCQSTDLFTAQGSIIIYGVK